MKTQTKAIIASVVVIALALAAISGVTYSWFSDSENTEVNVTTGKIILNKEGNLSATVTSFGKTPINIENNTETDLEGTVTLIKTSLPDTLSAKIIFNGMADNDLLSITVPKLTLTNTIKANYYESLKIIDSTTGEDITTTCSYFTVTGLKSAATEYSIGTDWTVSEEKTIEIAFDSNNTASGKEYNISLSFTAVQANAPIPSGQKVEIGEGEVSASVGSSISNGSSSVKFTTVSTETDILGTSFILKEATSETAESSEYTTVSGTNVISGLELKGYDSTGNEIPNYLFGKPVTMTFIIEGNVTNGSEGLANGVVIYHGDSVFTPGTGESIEASYSAASDKTTITVVTTQGFSPYFVTTGMLKVGNSYYNTLAEAIDADHGSDPFTIEFLGDIKGTGVKVPSGKQFIVDFNGFKYTITGETVGSTGTETSGFQLLKDSNIKFCNGTMDTIKGSGVMLFIQNYSNLTLSNMIIDGTNALSYTMSNNNGDVVIEDTTILPGKPGYAFDVYGAFQKYSGPSVTVSGSSIIKGYIEVDKDCDNTTNASTTHSLTINNGVSYDKIIIRNLLDCTNVVVSVDTGGTSYIENLSEKMMIYEDGSYVLSNAPEIVASIGDKEYGTLSEAMNAYSAEDYSSGTAIELIGAQYIIPTEIALKGKQYIFSGISGTMILIPDSKSYEHCSYALDGSTVTFNDLTIKTDCHYQAGYARMSGTYNNCVIDGTYYLQAGTHTFNNCTFSVVGDVYNLWTWGADNVSMNNCHFYCDGKSVLLYGEQKTTHLSISNSTFEDISRDKQKAAVEIGDHYSTNQFTVSFTNVHANGFFENPKGTPTGTTLWGNKDSIGTDRLTVTIDGKTVFGLSNQS